MGGKWRRKKKTRLVLVLICNRWQSERRKWNRRAWKERNEDWIWKKRKWRNNWKRVLSNGFSFLLLLLLLLLSFACVGSVTGDCCRRE
jgi:hypothetical protein